MPTHLGTNPRNHVKHYYSCSSLLENFNYYLRTKIYSDFHKDRKSFSGKMDENNLYFKFWALQSRRMTTTLVGTQLSQSVVAAKNILAVDKSSLFAQFRLWQGTNAQVQLASVSFYA